LEKKQKYTGRGREKEEKERNDGWIWEDKNQSADYISMLLPSDDKPNAKKIYLVSGEIRKKRKTGQGEDGVCLAGKVDGDPHVRGRKSTSRSGR